MVVRGEHGCSSPLRGRLSGPMKAPNLVALGTLGGRNNRWVAV